MATIFYQVQSPSSVSGIAIHGESEWMVGFLWSVQLVCHSGLCLFIATYKASIWITVCYKLPQNIAQAPVGAAGALPPALHKYSSLQH